MLKIEKTVLPSPEQWEIIIEGMRNPKNSWDRIDSFVCRDIDELCPDDCVFRGKCPAYEGEDFFVVGANDHKLMMGLAKGGPVHAKYRRMIPVYVTIDAPLYWWKEFDTYKVGTVANSCSTMHKIHSRDLVLEDFSQEHLTSCNINLLQLLIKNINDARAAFVNNPQSVVAKEDWYQMIQLLPSSYNQKRTVMLTYEVLCNIYRWRRDHKLDEWHIFCDWIESLPYSELIIGDDDNGTKSK